MTFLPSKSLFYIVLAALFFLLSVPHGGGETILGQSAELKNTAEKPDARIVLRQLKFDTQEELEESRRLLVSALAFDSGNADYHFELSRVYGALYDESVPSGKKKVGETHFLDMSQIQLEQVLMIRPNDVPAHYNLGVIYKRRGKMELARDAFQRVIQLTEKDPMPSASVIGSAWLQIGTVYEEQGFFEEARDAYMKARKIGGNRPEVQDALQGIGEKQTFERKTPPPRADGWTREYISGAEYTQFGADALRAQKQGGGIGALVPMAGMMLFDQFMSRRRDAREAREFE
ncbi:MAG TPA: hypothetical protein DIS66_01930 [Candidatus Omnitrophica bacterium]|nr:hypothetical protein [Candidatus Omnitrophota bacterium]